MRVSHKPTTTLRQLLNDAVKDRDEPNNRKGAVYKIKCSNCQASYIGETDRNLNARPTEHKRATKNDSATNHSAVHHQMTNYNIDWDFAQCLSYSSNYFHRLTLESWYKVTLVFRKGSKRELGNYRPISVLPLVSKMFEKFLYRQLYDYLQDNSLLNTYQSGFRSMHSTLTALLETTNNWSINIDKGLLNGVLFIDLRKAFDAIDHEIILRKLANYGVDQSALRFFASYLCNRSQKCSVNGVFVIQCKYINLRGSSGKYTGTSALFNIYK